MRKIVYWLSLVMIFTIPWEGAFHLPGFGTAATIMGLIVTALWIALVAMTGSGAETRHLPGGDERLRASGWPSRRTGARIPCRALGAVLRWIESLIFTFIIWDLYRTRPAILAGLQAYVLGTYVCDRRRIHQLPRFARVTTRTTIDSPSATPIRTGTGSSWRSVCRWRATSPRHPRRRGALAS